MRAGTGARPYKILDRGFKHAAMTDKTAGSLLKVLYKMTTPATDNHILHALISQRLVVQMVNVQMRFTPAQNALAIVMGEKLLPLNLP